MQLCLEDGAAALVFPARGGLIRVGAHSKGERVPKRAFYFGLN